VSNAALQKRDQVSQLSALEDELRLRLSAQAAGAACFDWNVSDGIITWDGATDILPVHLDARDACNFLDNISPERRAALLKEGGLYRPAERGHGDEHGKHAFQRLPVPLDRQIPVHLRPHAGPSRDCRAGLREVDRFFAVAAFSEGGKR